MQAHFIQSIKKKENDRHKDWTIIATLSLRCNSYIFYQKLGLDSMLSYAYHNVPFCNSCKEFWTSELTETVYFIVSI